MYGQLFGGRYLYGRQPEPEGKIVEAVRLCEIRRQGALRAYQNVLREMKKYEGMRTEEEITRKVDELELAIENDGDYRELKAEQDALEWVLGWQEEL